MQRGVPGYPQGNPWGDFNWMNAAFPPGTNPMAGPLFPPLMPYPFTPPITPPDTFQRFNQFQPPAPAQKKEKFSLGKAVTSFVKGATVNMIQGMLTPQGLAMLGSTFLLTMATHGLIIPFLLPVGLAMGGYQLFQGVKGAKDAFDKGDTEAGYLAIEQAGMGTSIMGLSLWGARTTYAKGAIHGKTPNPTITVRQSLGEMGKDVLGINKVDGKYIGRVALEELGASVRNLGKGGTKGMSASGSAPAFQTAVSGHAHTEHGLVMPPGQGNRRDQEEGLAHV